ncbi:MAG: fibronectin type III domain-containing protein [Acidimicrobiia bacterium]
MTNHIVGRALWRSSPHRNHRLAAVALVAALLTAIAGVAPAGAISSGTPTIGGTVDATYVEGDAATLVGSSLTIADGVSYGGQYLEFSIDGATSGETLGLQDDGVADTADGVVSVVGNAVYLGNGATADIVGSIDGMLTGANGTTLRVNFTSEFQNAGFETGDLTGWTAITDQIDLGSTTIASCPTVDTSTYPGPVPNEDNNVPAILGSLTTPVVTDVVSEGTYALQLVSENMITLQGYDVVHGPAVYSGPFEAASGDTIYFDWRAYAGDDDYHVFGYIIDESCNQTELLDATGGGNTEWATNPTVIPASGTYRFVFVSGTFDASGGTAAGASLYIDNVQVFGNKANDAVAQAVARKITYMNTDAESPSSRTLNVTAQSTGGSSSAPLTINVQTDPAITTGVTGTAGNMKVDISWVAPDAGSFPITDYLIQYSDDGGATWHTFNDGVSSATSATVTGLTNGVAYVFQVAAVNSVGAGPYSAQSDPLTPTATAPEAPQNVAGTGGNGLAVVTWDAPDSGGSPISDYVVEYSSDGGATWHTFDDGVSTETSVTVTGLSNGTQYLFRVSAVNAIGTGPAATSAAVTPQDLPAFEDTLTSIFLDDIQWLHNQGITVGCNPPLNTLFCPNVPLTRAETATFLDRWLDFAPTTEDFFSDDDGIVHEAALNRTKAADVFRGCNPPLNNLVCPDAVITRGEVAAVLVRALGLDSASPKAFTDTVGHLFENEIGILGGVGVSVGCNPPANDQFCPDQPITRGEMAAMLHRASELP